MAAKKSGGGAGRIRAKNQAMAAAMKEKGVERASCKCPVCHGTVSLTRLYQHLGSCGTR